MADSEVRKCLRCKSDLEKVKGIYTLVGLEQQVAELVVQLKSGIPVVVFACPKCGKLELFSASVLGDVKL